MKAHSHGVIGLVRPDDTEPDGRGWVAWSDGRGVARLSPGRTARHGLADIGSRPARPAAEPVREVTTFWSEVFAFFMEGFVLYGAALHPTAAMPVHAILAARRDWQQSRDGCEPPEPAQNNGGDEAESSGNVMELDRVRPLKAEPERRWSWLRSAGETLTVLLSHLRREQEIKRGVAALMELDDRTLRDLGIRGRPDIERVVRYGRDC